MDATIFLFDDVTALDAVGPFDALRRLPDVDVRFVGLSRGPVASGGGLSLVADLAFGEVERTDLLVLPGGGGGGLRAVMGNAAFLDWLRRVHPTARWTASVCTGALFLGAAGLIDGLRVSTHWRAKKALPRFGATYSGERVTEAGKIITAAGVSAGIDLGLRLCERIAGGEMARAVQLGMEYFPEPPFAIGRPEAEPGLVGIVEKRLRG